MLPFELGHPLEVHPVDPGDEIEGQKYEREDREDPHHLIGLLRRHRDAQIE